MDKLIAFIQDYKTLKQLFFKELDRLTRERLLGKYLKDYITSKDIVNSKPNPEIFYKYKKLCEESSTISKEK